MPRTARAAASFLEFVITHSNHIAAHSNNISNMFSSHVAWTQLQRSAASAAPTLLHEELVQRLLLLWFGLSVIGQLWGWPLLFLAASKSWLVAVALGSYMAYVVLGPGRHAAEHEAPWMAPWRGLPLWDHMAHYLSARLIKTAELDPSGRYVFAAYPHGISALSAWCCFATESAGFSKLFPGIRPYCLTLASNFKTPFLREYCLMYGLRSCDRRACVSLLERPGAAIVLFPGGAAEALVTEQGCYNVILARRKGFARVALQTGASLVPVLCFNETELFETYVPPPGSIAARLQALSHRTWGTSQPLFRGAGVFSERGLLPLRRPLATVVGAPIPVARLDAAEVGRHAFDAAAEHLHDQYVAALQSLFDEWKDRLAPGRRSELRIVG